MLNKRLACIAACVPKNSRVVDVGCDHAYLAIELIDRGIACTVVASDIVAGPIAAARKNIQNRALQDKIKLVQANGLQGVQKGEVDCVIIAGMGAGVIIDILEAGQDVIEECNILVLQPMVGIELLRKWLASHSWQIEQEYLIEENGIVYEILVSKPASKAVELSLAECYLGKLGKQELFPRYLEQLIKKQEKILAALDKAKCTEQIVQKRKKTARILQILREAYDES